jgi:NADH dehydrogenase
LKSAEEAKNIRHNILYAFEAAERINRAAIHREWLNFVIAGAGATVVELAGASAERLDESHLKREVDALQAHQE